MERKRPVATILLALLAIAWGAIPLIVREDIPVGHLVAMRVWLGALALLIALALLRRLRWPSMHRGRLIASGLILALHWGAFFAALKTTTVGVALAVLYLGPIAAAMLAPRILGEKVGTRVKVGLAFAFVGVLIVVRPESGATLEGVLWSLLAGATMAALMLVAKPAAEDLGGLVVAAGELVIAAIVLTPWMGAAVANSMEYWLEFLMLGVVLTGLAWMIYWHGMKYLPVAAVGVMMYLEPASAMVWAALFLDERPGAAGWIGVALVITGGVLAASETVAEEEIGVPTAF
jgi:drug/metabolite transporter (DMT)-like permease